MFEMMSAHHSNMFLILKYSLWSFWFLSYYLDNLILNFKFTLDRWSRRSRSSSRPI